MLSFWVQTLSFGFSPAWLRLGNVLLLAVCGSTLAMLLIRQWSSLSRWGAALIACAWVAHPLNSEATIWLSGRFDLFLLLGVIAALTLNLGESRRWSVPLVFAVSVLCKEPAVVLLPVLFIQDYFAGRPLRGELVKGCGLIGVALAYLGLRQLIGVVGAGAVQGSAPLVLVQSYATLLAVFSRLFLLPVGLDARHWYLPVAWPWVIVLLALAVASVVLTVKRAWRNPAHSGLVVGAMLSVLSLMPVSLVGPNQRIYGDRFASLFVVGLALASGALQPLVSMLRARLRWLSAAALLGCWSLLTLLRGTEWASEERLIASALAEHPEHPDWRVLQSHQFLDQGKPQAAIESLSELVQVTPGYAKAWNALCVAYLRTEQTQLAQGACLNALQLDNNSPSVWVNWASVQVGQRHWSEAIRAAERALQIRRTYPEARYLLAVSLAQLGQLAEAEQHVLSGLAEAPTHAALNDLKRQLDRRKAH
jgi:hypothetical protein